MSSVLVVGGGGREHTIAWKLSQSTRVQHVYVAPGNGGTSASKISNVHLSLHNHFSDLITFCKDKNISMVVVGPEQPLVDGIVDTLKKHGIPCFGPSAKAAVIESSKAFSKDFMQRHKIPTARYQTFTNYDEALAHLNSVDYSVVLKASGLAAGKGVLIPETKEEALEALKTLMVTKPFGTASDEVVIEERLQGPEVSVLAFTDGYTVSVMPPAQDHKRIGEKDTGENTGGMGAYAPTPLCSDSLLEEIKKKVLVPTVNGMRKEGRPYVGVIYAGILLDVKTGINVLEFNCRFGDPETQVLLPLLDSDILSICEACVEGRLDSVDVEWKSHQSAATVVAASKGYPGSYETGHIIGGLERVSGPLVFHAGTKGDNGRVVTSGGRVLAVTSVGPTLEKALEQSYKALGHIHYEGMYYRKDIGYRALNLQTATSVTYRDAGVDIDNADNLIDDISPMAKATARTGTDASLGGFGGLFDLKAAGFKDPILVSGTDGVGTKLLIAQTVGKHDTIGIDLVAMSVNDILVQGAEPLFFLDYYATGKLHREVARDVIKGIANGCKESNCALVGGETAEMPGMYPGGKYDLAGFAVGAVERDQVLPRPVSANDVLIGLPSSGIHSNGYSLVRHLVEKNNFSYHEPAPFDSSKKLGEALLTPTRLYVKSCMPLIKSGLVKAMAHITGGGITENLPRVLGDDVSAEVDLSSYVLPDVFQWMSKLGNIHQEELIRTFNCGIGMVLVVSADNAQEVLSKLVLHGENPVKLGKLVAREKYPVIYKGTWKSK